MLLLKWLHYLLKRSSPGKRGQNQCRQNADDGNDDEQFNQRKCAGENPPGTMRCRVANVPVPGIMAFSRCHLTSLRQCHYNTLLNCVQVPGFNFMDGRDDRGEAQWAKGRSPQRCVAPVGTKS